MSEEILPETIALKTVAKGYGIATRKKSNGKNMSLILPTLDRTIVQGKSKNDGKQRQVEHSPIGVGTSHQPQGEKSQEHGNPQKR